MEKIKQKEIEILMMLERTIRMHSEIYEREAANVRSRLLAGAKVEAGPYTASVSRSDRTLTVDGRPAISLNLQPRKKFEKVLRERLRA
jgi:hypothetical protein